MAEEAAETAGAEPAAKPVEPVDEAVRAASGLRTTATWIAGAFAGIPSLAVIGALIRAPGDAGFQDGYLVAGVLLAALGALIGILAFARVQAPIGLVDQTISPEVMNFLPEARFATYADLRRRLELARDEVADKRVYAADEAGRAAAAEAAAVQAEAAVKLLEEVLKDQDPPDPATKQEAALARREARRLRAEAGVVAGKSAIRAKELEVAEQILEDLEAFRRAAYGLQAGDTVRKRYTDAIKLSVVAVAFVAVGVIFLALAPEPKADEAAPVELVTLTLNPDGQAALDCTAETVDALKVGGEETAPTVIVLPGGECPVQAVEFVTEDPKPLGTVTASEVVEAE